MSIYGIWFVLWIYVIKYVCLYKFGPDIDTEEKCMTAWEVICKDLPMLRRIIRLSAEKINMKTKILCVEKWIGTHIKSLVFQMGKYLMNKFSSMHNIPDYSRSLQPKVWMLEK